MPHPGGGENSTARVAAYIQTLNLEDTSKSFAPSRLRNFTPKGV
jgi:hypothetical protein